MATQLSRDEQETHFSQTVEERLRGVWAVYTDDPYWILRLDRKGKLMRQEANGPGRHYEIEHRQLTLRSPGKKQATGHGFQRKVSERPSDG